MAVGRPREFDPERVLDCAMYQFWEHGYDGVSISDLTEATGINRRSLYATFGSKEQLFRDAVARYAAGPGGYSAEALARPTAWDVAYAMVHGAADTTANPDSPRGCLLVQGALAASDGSAVLRDELAQRRANDVARLAERFAQAQRDGEIPGEDPMLLARWISATSQGIAIQANSGASLADLHALADQALKAWPKRA